MALTAVVAGNRIVISDLNQIINLLTGVTGSGTTLTLINAAESLIFQPSSDPAAGTRVWTIKNNAGTVLASMRFDGLLKLLSAAAAPASAVVGSTFFDNVQNYFAVYDGTNWQYPINQPQPNLVLNSDFSRRTVFGLAMPEVFADTSAWTATAGTLGSVASNILTAGTTGTWAAKHTAPAGFYRDARFSATMKLTSDGGEFISVAKYVDESNFVTADLKGGATDTFTITKMIAGTPTIVATVAQAPTLNRWYWLELEAQGTTYIAKLYDTGGTTPGVTKASSTLLQTLTITIADAAVASGVIAVRASVTTAVQVGGIATGNGGVYVETWLPESHPVTFGGTLGGQAIGYDESTDAGPLGKQWALRAYIPAASRTITLNEGNSARGNAAPSTTYARSYYYKVSGLGGSGALADFYTVETDGAGADVTVGAVLPTGTSTTWTRVSDTRTTAATARGWRPSLNINNSSTATGTLFVSMFQLEQGSAATAWRNAPADDAPIAWDLIYSRTTDPTTTSGSLAEIDPRDLAGNLFLPWDATLALDLTAHAYNSAVGNDLLLNATLDGASLFSPTAGFNRSAVANTPTYAGFQRRITAAAGKHRIAATFARSAGTGSIFASGSIVALRIIATRGK